MTKIKALVDLPVYQHSTIYAGPPFATLKAGQTAKAIVHPLPNQTVIEINGKSGYINTAKVGDFINAETGTVQVKNYGTGAVESLKMYTNTGKELVETDIKVPREFSLSPPVIIGLAVVAYFLFK